MVFGVCGSNTRPLGNFCFGSVLPGSRSRHDVPPSVVIRNEPFRPMAYVRQVASEAAKATDTIRSFGSLAGGLLLAQVGLPGLLAKRFAVFHRTVSPSSTTSRFTGHCTKGGAMAAFARTSSG